MSRYGIDPRVWAAILKSAKKGTKNWDFTNPALVALAASACSEIIHDIKLKPYDSLKRTENSRVANQCMKSPVAIRNALAAWTMDQDDALVAIDRLSQWDLDLGVWCTCAAIDTIIAYGPKGDDLFPDGLEVARARSIGENALEEVEATADGLSSRVQEWETEYNGTPQVNSVERAVGESVSAVLDAMIYDGSSGLVHAMRRVVQAFTVQAFGVTIVNPTNQRSDEDYEDVLEKLRLAQGEEASRLREVIAQAIYSYPTSRLVKSSRGLSRKALIAGAVGAGFAAAAMHFARRS